MCKGAVSKEFMIIGIVEYLNCCINKKKCKLLKNLIVKNFRSFHVIKNYMCKFHLHSQIVLRYTVCQPK